MRADLAVHLEEALNLVDDAVEVAGLVTVVGGVGVAVHRVALPDDLVAGGLHCLDNGRQCRADLVVAHAGDQGQAPRGVVRVQLADVADGLLRGGRRADLHAHRVGDQGGEADVRVVQAAGALADPHLVCGQVVQRVVALFVVGQAQHCALVIQHQRLVGGEDVRGTQALGGHAASGHELQAAVDLSGQGLVAGTRRGVRHELAVPLVQLVQVGGAGVGQRTHQVHRRGGVCVGAHHAGRVVGAGFLGGLHAVDQVATVVQQTVGVAVRGARLRVLAGDAAHLHHRGGGAVGQHDRHLQQGLNVAAQVRLSVRLEGFGAVAALQQEGLAQGHVGQLLLQLLNFRGHHDRRHGFQDLAHATRVVRIPAGLLLRVAGQRVF